MSILNIVWNPSRVMVAVDTNCDQAEGAPALPDGAPVGPVCKLFPLPAFGAVLAGRGPVALTPLVTLAAVMTTAGQGIDFDGLVQRLPELIREVHGRLMQDLTTASHSPHFVEKFEFAAAGWSERRARMAAFSWWHYSADDGLQEFEIDSTWPAVIAPRFDYPWEEDPPRTPAAMLSLARIQAREAITRGPRGTGGRLLIAELTKASVSVTDYGELVVPCMAVLQPAAAA